ncbi:MAG: EAL domain-containing protein, partial [Pseudomonadota bacterium]
NVSGQQRMLSQRITLFANEMVFSNLDKEKIISRIQLGEALEHFADSHKRLTDETAPGSLARDMSPAVRNIYFSGSGGLDELSQRFIREVNIILNGSEAEAQNSVHNINAVAPFQLLDRLDAVAQAHERRAKDHAAFIANVANSVFALTLLVLAAIGILVILPTRQAIQQTLTTLKSSLAESESNRAMLEATFEQIDQGLVVYDADLRLVSWSRSFEKILELPPGWARKGRSIEEYFMLNAERGDYGEIADGDLEELVKRRMDRLQVDRKSIKPHRYVRKTAKERYIEIIGNPMPGGGMVTTFTDITQQEEAKQKIERLAWTDTLTGLLNRNALNAQLSRSIADAERTSMKLAFIIVDLDRFKPINDTYGHAAGDFVLQIVAERLRETIGSENKAFRLGGDEFALTVFFNDADQIHYLIDGLAERIRQPIEYEGRELNVSATVGIAVYPDHEANPVELIRKADTALYEAKEKGRGGFRIYDQAVDRKVRRLRWIEDELNRAIKREEFRLHFQPKVCARDTSIVGGEALIRWQHPVKGLMPPGEFIAVVERTDLVFPIGNWVMREAWDKASKWVETSNGEFSLGVNVSPRQFFDVGFRELLKELADRQPELTRYIELEITEEVMIGNMDEAIDILKFVDSMNYRISIDDFGTGYSSISYLHKLPVSTVKIDRSFISALGETARAEHVVRSIVDLGHNLGMKVVAEGVETEQQASLLKEARCDEFQGFLYSKPIPSDDFEVLLSKSQQARMNWALAS